MLNFLPQTLRDRLRAARALIRHAARRFGLSYASRCSVRALKRARKSRRRGSGLVLIGLIEHLGDIIACEPVARYIRSRDRKCCIAWAVRDAYRDLVAFNPNIDNVIEVGSLAEYDRLLDSSIADRVVDLHVNHRRCQRYDTVHHKRTGNLAIDVYNYYHYGSLLEAFSLSAGLPALCDAPQVHLPAQVCNEIRPLLPPRPFIVAHATSNEASRDWPTEKWRELLASLPRRGEIAIVEIGLRPRLAAADPTITDLCGRLSLLQMAETIRHAIGFIGVESGPAHIANAFRRPSVVLLGRYHAFDCYMPYTGFFRDQAKDNLVQWSGPVADLPVDVALERARRLCLRSPRVLSSIS